MELGATELVSWALSSRASLEGVTGLNLGDWGLAGAGLWLWQGQI